MNLQFILGKPGSGKTTLCIEQIIQEQEKTEAGSLVYIVPEQSSLHSEKALISKSKHKAIGRAKVLSFNRLSYYVFSSVGGVYTKILEDNAKLMLLRKVITDTQSRLRYFKSSFKKRGFIESLLSSITEFYQYNIEPEQLLDVAESAENNNLRLKLYDIGLIYSTYKQYLEGNYISSDEILDILVQNIPKIDFLDDAKIWIDGFKGFTPQERKVIQALIAKCKNVYIALTTDNASLNYSKLELYDTFYEPKETLTQIMKTAQILGATIEEPIFLENNERHKNSPELAFLCKNYLSFEDKIYKDKPRDIKIFAAQNIYKELHVAAKTITMLTRDRGYKYNDIGIVCTDLEKYRHSFTSIFSQYNIPIFIDTRKNILSHPLTVLVLSALDAVNSRLSYEAIFKMLRCGFCLLTRDETDILENYILEYGIKGDVWQKNFFYGEAKYNIDELNKIRLKLLDILVPLLSFNPNKNYNVLELSMAVYKFLQKTKASEQLQLWIDNARLKGDNNQLRSHEQIWGKIIDSLDKIVEILGQSAEKIGSFADILEAGLTDMGLAPPSLDQLLVGDLRRSRFADIKALLILGATEGAMPKRPSESSLLNDEDRQNIAKHNIELSKDSLSIIYEEEFLIYTNFVKPKEFLSISYFYGDLEGKGSSATYILDRIKQLFPKLEVLDIEDIKPNSLANISSKSQVYADMIASKRAAIDEGRAVYSIYNDALLYFKNNLEYANKLQNLKHAQIFESTFAKLSKASTTKLYAKAIRTNVSRIERFVACPFSYFVRYNLYAKERKLYEISAIDKGNIFHEMLALYGEFLKTADIEHITENEIKKQAGLIIDKVLKKPENAIFNSSGTYMNMAHRLHKIGEASAVALSRHLKGKDFKLIYNEVAFGDLLGIDNDMGLINIPINDEIRILLDGRIDRVDILEKNGVEYIKIIDYKSGKKEFNLSHLFYGLDLQLLIYLGAFVQKMGEIRGDNAANELVPAAALYFNLLNPAIKYSEKLENVEKLEEELLKSFKMSGVVLDNGSISHTLKDHIKSPKIVNKEELGKLITHAMDIAKQAGKDIMKGNIEAKPYKHADRSPCEYCKYRPVCKFDPTTNMGKYSYNILPSLNSEEVLRQLLK